MYRVAIAGGVVLLAVVGCGRNPIDMPVPDELTLYSIDGRDLEGRRGVGVTATPETFQGYPVLGKLEVTDPTRRKDIMAALRKAIADGHDEKMAECFWPRHGFRVVGNGKVVEFVACFECGRFDEFIGDKQTRHGPIDAAAQPSFDKPLTDAGIPIAPK